MMKKRHPKGSFTDDEMLSGNVGDLVNRVIKERIEIGKDLAKRYPKLKGLSFEKFIEKLPLDLSFIEASEMYKALNKK